MQTLLKRIFADFYDDVYTYLFSLSRDAVLSEDLASDVFLEAVKSIWKFRGDADIKTWLFSIARYKWFAYLRKKKKEPVLEPLEMFYIGADLTPEDAYIKKELTQKIGEILAKEPEKNQNIVLMRASGYSYYEIAQKHGISESSARVIAHRAKTKLKKRLQEEGYADE